LQTPAPFEYERASSIEGALASLQRLGPSARVIAGIRLWPPESSFAPSPCAAINSNALPTLVARA
jgi:CO/xanthine dehydrogenase FAD-binding subunit